MASRAIVTYKELSSNATSVFLNVDVAYVNKATGQFATSTIAAIALDPDSPANWKGLIATSVVNTGVMLGFSDLTAAAVYVPTYGAAA